MSLFLGLFVRGGDWEQSWSEYLDDSLENKLIVRFVFNEDFSGIAEFAVVYVSLVNGNFREIIRYDCSDDEAVNVHRFFAGPSDKRYLDSEKCFETLERFIDDIKVNWRLYRAKFMEKQI